MRERADAAGGWTRVEPNAAGGSVVEAWLPLQPADADLVADPDRERVGSA
jgi:hypothetical protein